MFGFRTLPFALIFGITWSPFGYAAHKRPEGQNLWGRDRSAVDFEVEAPGVVGLAGGQPALVSKVLAGSPIIGFCTRPGHVHHLPHPKDAPYNG